MARRRKARTPGTVDATSAQSHKAHKSTRSAAQTRTAGKRTRGTTQQAHAQAKHRCVRGATADATVAPRIRAAQADIDAAQASVEVAQSDIDALQAEIEAALARAQRKQTPAQTSARRKRTSTTQVNLAVARAGTYAKQTGFVAVLGSRRGCCEHQRSNSSEETLAEVRDAAERGAVDEIHRLLGNAGAGLLRSLDAVCALNPLAWHFCRKAPLKAERALWETLGCDCGEVAHAVQNEVASRFASELSGLLDATCAPPARQLQKLAGNVRSAVVVDFTLSMLRSWAGEARARLSLVDPASLRARLGLAKTDPLCSVLDAEDAAEIVRAVTRVHMLTDDFQDASDELERQLRTRLRRRANERVPAPEWLRDAE